MARIPLLERAFGQDRLARVHRLVGFTSFNLMLAHIVLITWGYAAGELARTPATIWDLTLDYPGMLLAVGRHRLPGAWPSSPASRPPAAGCATSPGTCCTCTPTSASAWPCRTSSGPARSSSPPPPRTVYWWSLVGAPPRPPSWSGGSASRCGAAPGTASGSTSVVAEGDGVVSVYLTGRRPAPAAAPRRASSSAGGSSAGRAGPGPTRTRCRPRRTGAACGSRVKDLGDGSAASRGLPPRHAGC